MAIPSAAVLATNEYATWRYCFFPFHLYFRRARKFTVRATVTLDKDLFLRSNYSANADIALDRRENALAINEGNLIIEEKKNFVEVENRAAEV